MSKEFQGSWIVRSPGEIARGGRLYVDGDGRVCKPPAAEGAPRESLIELGDVVILPGYVNAHAHLELPSLKGTCSDGFVPWIGDVLTRRRELTHEDYATQVRWGAERALATGTTALGDVNSTGAGASFLAQFPMRTRLYREVLDGDDAARTADQVERLESPVPPGLDVGIAPHAPHTVSDELLNACARAARAAELPVTVHWAETSEEVQWLATGGGPFEPFFAQSPGCRGLERLQRAGLVDGSISLVHGNHPGAGELDELGRLGATLVHCPGTHEYFRRPAVNLAEWAAAGLNIALGTDSLASNADLDMGREMSLVRAEHPDLQPATVLEWATLGGARALAMEDRIGDLAVGKWADFLVVDGAGLDSEIDVLDAVTGRRPEVLGVWIAGRQVWGSQRPANRP